MVLKLFDRTNWIESQKKEHQNLPAISKKIVFDSRQYISHSNSVYQFNTVFSTVHINSVQDKIGQNL